MFLSSSEDSTVRLWDIRQPKCCRAFLDPLLKKGEMGNVVISHNGNDIYCANGDKVWFC